MTSALEVLNQLPIMGPDSDQRLISRASVALMVYRELGGRAPTTPSGRAALKRAERLLSKTMLDLINSSSTPTPLPEETFVPTKPSRRRVPITTDDAE